MVATVKTATAIKMAAAVKTAAAVTGRLTTAAAVATAVTVKTVATVVIASIRVSIYCLRNVAVRQYPESVFLHQTFLNSLATCSRAPRRPDMA